MTSWADLTDWWLEEINDPAYVEDVLPLALDVLEPQAGGRYADLGCGEGRVMRAVSGRGAWVVGVDVNLDLLRVARRSGPVAAGELPDLEFLAPGSFDGAYVVLALEHVRDATALFRAAGAIVRAGGVLAAVLNHPVYTAPDSGPVLDPTDDEIYWRFGRYLQAGSTREPAGGATVEFVHRSMSELLNVAAGTGWALERMEERGVGAAAAGRDPLLARHGDIPHLLGVRWRLRQQAG